jgi:exodeoxyribonuclease VII large subunit
MPRTGKSQWDFGELFAAADTRRVLTVTELTAQVKRLLEGQVGAVWVSGEITNFRLQSSGHCYFTLKDAGAQLACVLFRGQTGVDRSLLGDGRKVLLHGGLTVYEPRGQYQMLVDAVEAQGLGALQLAFARLKQRLQAEGLFAAERKRPLPRHPERVGLVTSPTGAALRDVLHVVGRRHPALRLLLVPCRVQGEGAAEEIAAALSQLNAWSAAQPAGERLDLILVTRGGGSLEDLWAFNEEAVARAIFASALPVVSAIGHEVDFTISDFVADVRAATPSAAAELLTEDAVASQRVLAETSRRLGQLVRQRLEREGERWQHWLARLARAHPRRRLDERWQRLDDLQGSLTRQARTGLRAFRLRWQAASAAWARVRPAPALAQWREQIRLWEGRLRELARRQCETHRQRLTGLADRLRLLSPEQVLARGYSITRDAATGTIIRRASATGAGQVLRTRLHEGEVRSIVEPSAGSH